MCVSLNREEESGWTLERKQVKFEWKYITAESGE